MSHPAPVMPVYTDAVVADTIGLTIEQFGAYTLLVYAMWRNRGEPLSNDDQLLARICRVPVRRWRKSIKPALAKFFDVSGENFRNKFVEEEWQTVEQKIQQNRVNGSLGGKAKALKNKETPLANALPYQIQIHKPDPDPDSLTESPNGDSPSSPSQERRERESEFEEIWKLFPKKVSKGHALKAYIAARKQTSFEIIRGGVERHRVQNSGRDPEFIPHPATWLNGKRWLDDEPTPSPATGRTNGHALDQWDVVPSYRGPTTPPPRS